MDRNEARVFIICERLSRGVATRAGVRRAGGASGEQERSLRGAGTVLFGGRLGRCGLGLFSFQCLLVGIDFFGQLGVL